MLASVGEAEPQLPSRTPDDIEPYPFEDAVHRLIEAHKQAKAERERR